MRRFRFVDAQKARFPVSMLGRMVGVSKSGYYAWKGRPPSKRSRDDALLTEKIREIHERSRLTYGYPRVDDELEMAVWGRKPEAGLVHHSDRGTQYTALSFGKRLEEAGIVPSMGRAGSALDNAVSESFVATLKCELVHCRRFPTREAARSAVFGYLEAFYNRRRRHSSRGYVSPESYEDLMAKEEAAA